MEKLNIVNDRDEIIGEASRKEIHAKGLLHREIHVWFYTPKGEIVFQHRAKDKDTYPDLLDATVGGHVELGATYEETAVKEMQEETGVPTSLGNLKFLTKFKMRSEDSVTHTVNQAFKSEYAFLFAGSLDDLKIEKGKAVGFEVWSIEKLLNISKKDRKRFIPSIFNNEIIALFIRIKDLI